MKIKTWTFAWVVLALLQTACKKDDTPTPTTPEADRTDDVVEIAIRQVKTGQLSSFETARSSFIGLLTKEQGVFNDREYASFYHYNPAQDQARPVYVGMTQYEDLATFQRVGQKLGTAPEAGAFFGTFDALLFTALKPLKAGTKVDISQIAKSGQVLEIAVRDLSLYSNFNKADYEAKRDAFLALLAQQPARVAEYQWVSVLNPNIVVGMTVYTSPADFMALSTNATFINNPAVGAFINNYPPNKGGEVCSVVK